MPASKMPVIDPVTMSGIDAATAAAAVKPSLPIELLPTDVAKIVSQAHPALLLAAYYFRFPALVAEPVPTLLQSILPVALIQTVYAVLCLPAVGSGTKLVKKAKLNAPKKTELPTGNAFV
jgi:phosphatidylinositol glycan class F